MSDFSLVQKYKYTLSEWLTGTIVFAKENKSYSSTDGPTRNALLVCSLDWNEDSLGIFTIVSRCWLMKLNQHRQNE